MNIPRSAILAASLSLLAGCGEKDPRSLVAGQELYDYYCLGCHASRGPGARLESRAPDRRPLASHEVFILVKYGYHERHRNLPAFPHLRPDQVDSLSDYVVQLQQQPQLSARNP